MLRVHTKYSFIFLCCFYKSINFMMRQLKWSSATLSHWHNCTSRAMETFRRTSRLADDLMCLFYVTKHHTLMYHTLYWHATTNLHNNSTVLTAVVYTHSVLYNSVPQRVGGWVALSTAVRVYSQCLRQSWQTQTNCRGNTIQGTQW